MNEQLKQLIILCDGDLTVVHTIILAAQDVGIDWRSINEVVVKG